MTTEPDTASPDGKKKKILDRVSFEALGESLIGTVTAIKGEALTVVDENGRE